jgi:hypothetical protein
MNGGGLRAATRRPPGSLTHVVAAQGHPRPQGKRRRWSRNAIQTVVIKPVATSLIGLKRRSHYWRGPPSGTSPAAIRTLA